MMDLDEVLKILIKDFLSSDGRLVNYAKFKDMRVWRPHMEGDLVRIKGKSVAQEGECYRKAFFINLYNVMCIYAVCLHGKLNENVSKIKEFFDQKLCIVAGEIFSLDDILHGVLRADSPHPSSKTPHFQNSVSKRKFSLKAVDPRVLFAVNSADMSSPPIRHFSSVKIDQQLDAAVAEFCTTQVSWNPVGKIIVVPRLLLWYRRDFPGGHDVATVRWVARHLDSSSSLSLQSLLNELEYVGGVRIVHNSHDWRLNQFSSESITR